MNKKLILCGIAGLVLNGCSFKSKGTSQIEITLPPDVSQQLASPLSSLTKVGNQSLLNSNSPSKHLVGMADPLIPSDFTCFGINVSGPGIPTNPAVDACTEADMPAAGIIGGFAPISGGSVQLDVPVGTSRVIQLFTFQSKIGCPSFSDAVGGKFGSLDFGIPFEIGRAVVDISADVSVNIEASWDPLKPKRIFCPKGNGVPVRVFVVGAANVNAKDCVPYRVEVQDSKGALVNVEQDLAVAFSDSVGAEFFKDKTCTQLVDKSFVIPKQTNNASFYYRAKTVAPRVMTASAPGIEKWDFKVNALAPPAAKFITTGLSSLASNVCSPVTVKAVDVLGASVNVPTATSVAVNVTSGDGKLYSDNACATTGLASLNAIIPAGSSQVIIYYKGTSSSNVILSIQDPLGKLTADPYSFAVTAPVAGAASKLVFLTQPSSSGVAGTPLAVSPVVGVQDANGIQITSNTSTIQLSASTQAGCTNHVGTLSAGTNPLNLVAGVGTFSNVKFNHPGTVYIKASGLGLAPACFGPINISAGGPNQVVIRGPSLFIQSSIATLTASLIDSEGNLVNTGSPISVNLSKIGGLGLYSDAAATTAISSVVIPAGSNTATFYARDPILEVTKVIPTVSASTITGVAADFVVTSGTTSPSFLSLSGNTEVQSGQCAPYVLQVKDGNNAIAAFPSTPSSRIVSLSSAPISGNPQVSFYSNAACTTSMSSITVPANATSMTFYMMVNGRGVSKVKAIDGANLILQGETTLVSSMNNLGPTQLMFYEDDGISAQSCKSLNLVAATEEFLPASVNPATSITVSSTGSGLLYPDQNCTSGSGSYSFAMPINTSYLKIYFKDNVQERVTINATASAGSIRPAAMIQVIKPPNTGSNGSYQVSLDGIGNSVMSGFCQPFRLRLKDSNGAIVSSPAAVSYNLSFMNAPVGRFYSSAKCNTTPNTGATLNIPVGESASGLMWFMSSSNEDVQIHATTSAPSFPSTLDWYYRVGTGGGTLGSVAALQISGPKSIVQSSECAMLTVNSTDSYGRLASVGSPITIALSNSGATGAFYMDSGCGTSTTTVNISAGNQTTVYYKATGAIGTMANVSATSSGLGGAGLGMCVTAAGAPNTCGGGNGATRNLQIVGGLPPSISVSSCMSFQLQSVDGAGVVSNVSSPTNFIVALAAGAGTSQLYSDASCTTSMTTLPLSINAGASTSNSPFYFKGTGSDSIAVSVTSPDVTFPTNMNWYSTIPSGGAVQTPVTANLNYGSTNVTPVGGACLTFNIQTVDAWNRTSSIPGTFSNLPITVGLEPGSFPGEFFNGTCGTAGSGQPTLTANISVSTFNAGPFYFRPTGGTAGWRNIQIMTPSWSTISGSNIKLCGGSGTGIVNTCP